ncbi:MAG: hypothetical protein QOE83_977 [Actinomycetota bacterium]|nr:hypothetical protein [Actinomycetota bacterium]
MTQPRTRRALVASTILALAVSPMALSAFGGLAVSAHAAGTTVHKYSLGAKATLRTYHFATGPEEVRVITLTQGGGLFDIATAGSKFGTYQKPSAIASNAYETSTGRHPALAGTNGDFATNGMSAHLEQVDGEIWSSALSSSPRFAINADGSHAWIGNSDLSMTATVNGTKVSIDHWNAGKPGQGQITAYTEIGGSSQKPPGTNSPTSTDPAYCAVRLLPTSAPHWSDANKSGITRSFKVDKLNTSPCPKTPMAVDPTSVVLASRDGGAGGSFLTSLTLSDSVNLTWRSLGWNGVIDSVGGTPILVNNGVNVGPDHGPNYIYNDNPRTAIGINAGCSDHDLTTLCKVYLVTVDGRRAGWSAGWKMNQLGAFFVHRLHAKYALNMDGGGGTVMWAHKDPSKFAPCIKSASAGCLVNKPSDGGGERVSVMALVGLPGDDIDIPQPLR